MDGGVGYRPAQYRRYFAHPKKRISGDRPGGRESWSVPMPDQKRNPDRRVPVRVSVGG
jgi:hypothetical protein